MLDPKQIKMKDDMVPIQDDKGQAWFVYVEDSPFVSEQTPFEPIVLNSY